MSHDVIDRCWGIHGYKATKLISNDRSYNIHEIEETCDSCGLAWRLICDPVCLLADRIFSFNWHYNTRFFCLSLRKAYMFFSSLAIARQMSLADPLSSKVALSGSVIMSHSYDDIPLFVSRFNILVRLDNLLQRIGSIYNRF